jgi:hypothetical protein
VLSLSDRRPFVKILTLWQPWASLVSSGAKRIETRSWSPARGGMLGPGPLLIHAGRHWDGAARKLCFRQPFRSALFGDARPDPKALPLGCVLALVHLYGFRPTSDERGEILPWARDLAEPERSFGDYKPGRFGWFLGDPEQLSDPIPWPGRQLLRQAPAELVELVGQQIGIPREVHV